MTTKNSRHSVDLNVLQKQVKDTLAKKEGKDKPVIAVWGMMNAGKSYLLNMLTQHYSAEYFPTNDIRETAKIRQFEGEAYIFLDTPGLDANDADDQVAMDGAAKADVVLFVHQPRGELEKIELDFLKNLKESFGFYAQENIVLVISKTDVESLDKIEQIEQKVLEQCNQYLGFTPASFLISGTRFHKGIQQHKEGLVKASHLEKLKQHIETLGIDISVLREEKVRQIQNTLLTNISVAEGALNDEKQQLEDNLHQDFISFDAAMLSLDLSMTMKRAEYLNETIRGE
ncbi:MULTISPECIES: GTPase [unclassified Pseudoalteromonas]|uniref:GTPase n=1 Tax=unclassified Pseudoalteromonas TaxID=194690 RepID=UPI003333DA58